MSLSSILKNPYSWVGAATGGVLGGPIAGATTGPLGGYLGSFFGGKDKPNETSTEATGAEGEEMPAVEGGGMYDEWLKKLGGQLELEHYNGPTDMYDTYRAMLDMSPEERALYDLTGQMVSGEYGNFKQALSGEADYGLINRSYVEPMRNQLMNTTLPALQDMMSGGPFGAGYYSGALGDQTNAALNQYSQGLANAYTNEANNAYSRMFSANAQMPAMQEVLNTPREITAQALGLDYQTFMGNNNLDLQAYGANSSVLANAYQAALGESQVGLGYAQLAQSDQQYQDMMQMYKDAEEQAQKSSLFNLGGTLLGGGLGLAMGGPMGGLAGAGAGGAIGSSLGGYFGGTPSNMSTGANSALQSYMLYSLMNPASTGAGSSGTVMGGSYSPVTGNAFGAQQQYPGFFNFGA